MTLPEFVGFPKMSRLNRTCIVTEKIDGTNAQIFIADDFETILFGSRTKWITPEDDNYGFARWGTENKAELLKLGPGQHFGEWWGAGIQRRYGLTEKRFSLFNATRWADDAVRPKCCHVVPVLAQHTDIRVATESALTLLREKGSIAAPGFMKPEGVVIFHTASGQLFKVTLEKDESRKSEI
jgi:hypothetical protein